VAALVNVRVPLSGSFPPGTCRALVKALQPPELNDGTTVLKRSQMYEGMKAALGHVVEGDTIRLSSFQLGHPLLEPEPAIGEYHRALHDRLVGRTRPVSVNRIVSIQTLKKVRWVDELAQQFSDTGVNFNLRLYPSRPQWETEPEVEPLPLQVQIIGGTVFVGGGRVEEREVTSDIWAIQIDRRARQGRDVSRFFERHHLALWNYASREGCDLIENGAPNVENIDNLKWTLCCSWLRHHARAVKTESELVALGARAAQEFRTIPEWYRAPLQPPRHTRQPYRRNVIDRGPGDGKVEMMLAQWQRGGECWPHDHGGAAGVVLIVRGAAQVTEYDPLSDDSFNRAAQNTVVRHAGQSIAVDPHVVHSMKCMGGGDAGAEPLVTLHLYYPRPKACQIVDVEAGKVYRIKGGGAHRPDPKHILGDRSVRLTSSSWRAPP
jgi:hypothetical protein